MKIPKKIKVAGINYQVKETDLVVINGSTDYVGSINQARAEIEVLNSLSKTRKEQTLVHEILHACFYEAGFDEHDEDVVNRVSVVLYQVLKDNDLNFK